MGVPCSPVSTVEVASGTGISVVLAAGVYTVSIDPSISAQFDNYKVYATEAARDADNPAPSSGDAAWITADDRLFAHDGTGWIIMAEPEQTYTPTYTNVTLGTSPTRVGTYHRSDGYIDFSTILTLGTGGAFTGQPTISVPVALAARQRGWGWGGGNDSGTLWHLSGAELAAGATVVAPLAWATGGTYLLAVNLTATIPFTWAIGDILSLEGRLEMNTRYL